MVAFWNYLSGEACLGYASPVCFGTTINRKSTMSDSTSPKATITPQGLYSRRQTLRTLTLLLLEAAGEDVTLKLAYSVGDGYFFHFHNGHRLLPSDVDKMKEQIQRRIEADVPIETVEMERDEALRHFHDRGMVNTFNWVADHKENSPVFVMQNGDLYAFDGPLYQSTGQIGSWDLIPYPPGLLLRIPPSGLKELTPNREHATLFRCFFEGEYWGEIHRASYVSEVNKVVHNGKIADLIQVSEAQQELTIGRIAQRIQDTMPRPMVVLVSGPSASGKTSFSMRLSTHLRLLGLKPVPIGLDNYYKPRKEVPRTPDGDYDYESLEALDVELFNETLLRLISGETVRLPSIDFETHERIEGQPVTPKPNTILIVEGIHGLNPALTPHLTAPSVFKVYVSALTGLNFDNLNRVSTADVRLLRRLVRDRRARGYDADDTISRWSAVRAGELKHIFPYQEEADVMFNSALPFELNALKSLAEEVLNESNDSDLANEVARLQEQLAAVLPLDPEFVNRHLPPTSIMREFTGGSVLVD